ncbi:MAG: hypothetical protein NTW52_11220 [Planctomycetota bacterium]|nr:hypothetical protein [Planctomycetota bacterium]
MDWVKPKSDRALPGVDKSLTSSAESTVMGNYGGEIILEDSRKKSINGTEVHHSNNREGQHVEKVTTWLEKLCQDNVPSLQKSPKPPRSKKSRKSTAHSSTEFGASMRWGTATLQVDIEEGPEVLAKIVELWQSPIAEGSESRKPKQLKSIESISKWIVKSLPVHGFDVNVGLVSASWIHGLRELGGELPQSLWLETLQSILTQVDRAWSEEPEKGLFPWLLWACEVPLALATKLSHLGGKDRMVLETIERLNQVLEAADDSPENWLIHGGHQLRACLASIVRCSWSMSSLGTKGFYAKQRKSLAKLVELAVRLSDRNGGPLLNEHGIESDDAELWNALSEICAPNKKLDRLLQVSGLRTLRQTNRKSASRSLKAITKSEIVRLPALGFYSEKAELASMRKAWDQPGVRMAIDYSQEPMRIDILDFEGNRIISGDWDLQITREGQAIETDVGWSDVCWFSDDDVDYLEIECGLEGVVRIQRQMMLIRDESMIFMCDTLLADQSANWGVRSILNVAPDFEVRQDKKHHEAELHHRDSTTTGTGDGRHALVLPLALPEWRRSPSIGKLEPKAGQLVLSQESLGNRLMCPMVIVPRKPSKNQPYTWRHLTVAEDLQIQPREIAQAYRVQVGKDQMVFYRSLAKTIRRSAMGLHMNSEFYAARFDPSDGEFEPIVEIDSDE